MRKTYRFNRKKFFEQALYLKFDIIKKQLLDKLQSGGLIMKKDINSNIKDSDTLKVFFECITSCTINSTEWISHKHVS